MRLFADKKYSGPLQMALVELIEERTYGSNPKRPWVRLTLTELAKFFGKSRQAVVTALDDAERRGLIESQITRTGRSFTKRFRLSQLQSVKPCEAPQLEVIEGGKKKSIAFGETVSVMAGGSSRAIQLSLFPDAKSVDVPGLKLYNHLKQGFAVKFVANADGGFEVHILQASKASPKKEDSQSSPLDCETPQAAENKETPKTPFDNEPPPENEPACPSCGNQLAHFAGPELGERGLICQTPGCDLAEIDLEDEPEEWERDADPPLGLILAEYRDFLRPLLLERWSKVLDESFLLQIVTRAKRAPIAIYTQLVRQKLAADKERKLNRGILLNLADDAAAARSLLLVPAPPQRPQPIPMTEEQRARLEDMPVDKYEELIRVDPDLSEWRKHNA